MATIRLLAVGIVCGALLALSAPANAYDGYDLRHDSEELNGRLMLDNLSGGVQAQAYRDDGCCYGGYGFYVAPAGFVRSSGLISPSAAYNAARAAAFFGGHGGGHR